MTTEELEKKLKISKNTCIHCLTEELAKQVLSILHQLGLKWCNGKRYTLNSNWDNHKENTIYYPFDGERSSLEFAQLAGFEIINAEEFIILHTEGKEFDLQNYEPKGELKGFPKEIIARMLDCQEEQGNPRDVSTFENRVTSEQYNKGFNWNATKEGRFFWYDVINNKYFNLFFEKHSKQDPQDNHQDNSQYNPQEFKVGEEVFDIILGQKGKILQISTDDNSISPICASFNGGKKTYALDGRHHMDDKYPRLLHYRDDYDYSIIDFNNLPERQNLKRWRAEKEGMYYCLRFDTKGRAFADEIRDIHGYDDNANYNSGNYFRTEVEAEIIAQKLNTYFKQLIQEEHEHKRI